MNKKQIDELNQWDGYEKYSLRLTDNDNDEEDLYRVMKLVKLGYDIGRVYSHNYIGIYYLEHDQDTIIKEVGDIDKVKFSSKVLGKNFKHIVKVKRLFTFKNYLKNELFYIVEEKLEPLSKKDIHELQLNNNLFYEYIFNYFADNIDEEGVTKKFNFIINISPKIKDFINQMFAMKKELRAIGHIPWDDFHDENIMKKGNIYKFMDFDHGDIGMGKDYRIKHLTEV